MDNHTPKNFVLQLGALVALYVSITFLTLLLFSSVNLIWPDALDNYWQISQSEETIRIAIAVLVIFFPTYLYLTHLVNEIRRRESSNQYIGLARWLVFLSLFVGGVIILVDFATIVYNFLAGEVTTRFLAKALILMAIVGFAFHYYLRDIKGYWITNKKASLTQGVIIGIVVIGSFVVGLSNISSPAVAREIRLDQKQLSDLQMIQEGINGYVASNGMLPKTLEDVYQGAPIPQVEGRPGYTYITTGDSYSLCATFGHDSVGQDSYFTPGFTMPVDSAKDKFIITNYQDWNYKAGQHCFDRELKKRID